jgi:hypothetical protein
MFLDESWLGAAGRHGCVWFWQQYRHPQADAMETAFSKSGNPSEVVTDGGHREK